jgi:hypothetical protein|tara:strand:+ start:203 stop:364 length:162 start_codon:yes stop_codon:yes gene_type:complete
MDLRSVYFSIAELVKKMKGTSSPTKANPKGMKRIHHLKNTQRVESSNTYTGTL